MFHRGNVIARSSPIQDHRVVSAAQSGSSEAATRLATTMQLDILGI